MLSRDARAYCLNVRPSKFAVIFKIYPNRYLLLFIFVCARSCVVSPSVCRSYVRPSENHPNGLALANISGLGFYRYSIEVVGRYAQALSAKLYVSGRYVRLDGWMETYSTADVVGHLGTL